MMADDLAAEDLSFNGGSRVRTPRLDKLASEGISLTSYYAGNPVCSPSRMALLSGSYPARLGWRWGVLGYGFPPLTGMSPRVYTMAEAFRDAGYRTAIAGKWHLGVQGMSPGKQGFDSAYYIRMSNNQNRDMMRDGKMVRPEWDNTRLTETFAEECIRVIKQKSDKPFFLYVPWSAPHFPAEPHPDWHGKSGEDKNAMYIDTVAELDQRVGQVLDALDESGKSDNTIVIFTSDNGRQKGQQGPNPKPVYRGMKWQSLEGGTRVPCFVRFPGKIKPGTTSDALIAAIDLYPTLTHACGVAVNLPADAQKMDGVNAWAEITGRATKPSRTELLYWHGKGQATGIRMGDWKLLFNFGDENPKDPQLTGPALFNLKDDVKEKTNLASKHPDRVATMMARAKELLTDVYSNQIPLGACEGAEPPKNSLTAEDVWGKWMR